METTRIVIYAKDIGRITGKSERYARTILSCIRKKYGKEKHQLVSISDFCRYTGLDEEEIINLLR
jgi:predicted RNA-binding protein YlqC (UPF0109 family)